MKRKKFIKTTATIATGVVLAPMAACKHEKKIQVEETQVERTNWAGNYTYKAKNLYEPKAVEEVQALVKKLDTHKALGSCHCFNNIADKHNCLVTFFHRVVSQRIRA